MGSQVNSSASASASAPSSPGGKRSRDPEDEVYLDNLHSHKRYLSEIMASSLNGLTVGDQLPDNLMESPARSESLYYLRDECTEYSPMSEDSDDSRYSEAPANTCLSQPESLPTTPLSPYRCQRPLSGPTNSHPIVSSSQPRQRGSDSEGRFPSSPSDICHSADLRRAALLRSVHMRTQPLGQEAVDNIETEERQCSYMKTLVSDSGYEIEECSLLDMSEPEFTREKSCRVLNTSMGVNEPADTVL